MNNDTPHSYTLRAREIDRLGLVPSAATGKFRQPARPTDKEVAILRRIARGFLLVTKGEKGDTFTYEDGSPVTHEGKHGFPLTKFLHNRWIKPVEGEELIEGMPQRYVLR